MRERTPYPQIRELDDYLNKIIEISYPELLELSGNIFWKSMTPYAQVIISNEGSFRIDCNSDVRYWPEPALLGLIAHELSHVVLRNEKVGEEETDKDVIAHGMGHFLAVERLFAGKYKDHLISSGNDKYLGYDTIRKELEPFESLQLYGLLNGLNLIPKEVTQQDIVHDNVIRQSNDISRISVDGKDFFLTDIPEKADIKIVIKSTKVEIYIDEELVESSNRC